MKYKKKIIYVYTILLLLMFSLLIHSLLKFCYDSDTSFLIASGRYIIDYGIPHTNPFTFLPGLKIIIQQWLWDIIICICYDHVGILGIFSLCVFMTILTSFSILIYGSTFNNTKKYSSFLIGLFFCIIGIRFFSSRPTAITVILIFLQLSVLEVYKKTLNKKILLWLIVITFLETNFHSSLLLMHFILLLPYVVPPIKNPLILFKKVNYGSRTAILKVIPAMLLVSLINPYGLDGIMYLFLSYGDKLNSIGIIELAPVEITSYWGLWILLGVSVFACFLLFAHINKISLESDSIYLICGMFFIGIFHMRSFIYFLIGGIVLTFIILNSVPLYSFEKFALSQKNLIILLSAFVTISILFMSCLSVKRCINSIISDSECYPVSAIEYLDQHEKNPETLKIYTSFNNGAFFELHGYKCFIDARPELYFESINKKYDYMSEFLNIRKHYNNKEIHDFIEKYDFDYLCVDIDKNINIYIINNTDYEPVVTTEEYILYKR